MNKNIFLKNITTNIINIIFRNFWLLNDLIVVVVVVICIHDQVIARFQ